MENRSDDKRLKKLLLTDEDALVKFYHLHKDALIAFISRTIANKDVREEVMQEAFFDFVEALPTFAHKASLKTFLFSIARHKVLDYLRKKKIKQVFFSHIPESMFVDLGLIFNDESIDHKELSEKIQSVLEALPDDYRVVLRLKYMEERPVKEIAKKMHMKFKAVESLLYRARTAFIQAYDI